MKVALAISGKFRNFKHAFPRMKQYLIDPLKPDIYFYGHPNKEGMDECELFIQDELQPIDYRLYEYTEDHAQELRSKYAKRDYSRKAPTTSLDLFLAQYYNLKELSNLITTNPYGYDLVIRSRCDVFYNRELSPPELQDALDGKVVIPNRWDFSWVSGIGCSDVFCIANQENFNKYASIIDHFDEYYQNGCLFHHESVTGWHIREQKLNRVAYESPFEFEYPADLAHIGDQNRHNY